MAGSNDFTGQNIQDTYQRVLQLSSSGQLSDGTGSLVSLLKVTASFAVSASHEVTHELSSSFAQTASSANDGFVFRGNATSSGNISSSGNIFANRFGNNLEIIDNGVETTLAIDSAAGAGNSSLLLAVDGTTKIRLNKDAVATTFTGNTEFDSPISASDNISSSGDIRADAFLVRQKGGLTSTDNLTLQLDAGGQFTGISYGREGSLPPHTFHGMITASSHISSSGRVIGNRIQGDVVFTTTITSSKSDLGITEISELTIGELGNAQSTLIKSDSPEQIIFTAGNDASDIYFTINSNYIAIDSDQYLDIQQTTAATDNSGDTGALRVEGGASIAKNISTTRITASSHISSSGILIGGGLDINGTTTFNEGNITNVGTIDVDTIRADLAQNVRITLGTNGINIKGEAGDLYAFNEGEIDADFKYYDAEENELLHMDAGLSRIGISDITPSSKLDVAGDLNIQSHITASGNIRLNGYLSGSSGTTEVRGNISASGHIISDKIINPTIAGIGSSNATLKIDATGLAYHSHIEFAKGGTTQWVLGSDSVGSAGSNDFRIIKSTGLNNANGLFITSSNYNVGIGTVNAVEKLTVEGNISGSDISATDLISAVRFACTGRTTFGNSADDRHVITGNITASNNISSSGDIIANQFVIDNTDANGILLNSSANATLDIAAGNGGGLTNVYVKSSQLEVAGNLMVDQDLIHRGDTDTKITFGTDQMDFIAGNVTMIALDETDTGNSISLNAPVTSSGNISSSGITSTLSVPRRHLDHTVQTSVGTKAQGDIYYAQVPVSTDVGKVYAFIGNTNHTPTDIDNINAATSLLAVALTSNATGGMLLRGMVKLATDPCPGGSAFGNPVYMGDSGATTGSIAGYGSDDYIRIVGHYMSGSGTIYFNPDNTFIKKA